jgi:hypothetical protein
VELKTGTYYIVFDKCFVFDGEQGAVKGFNVLFMLYHVLNIDYDGYT